MNKNIAKMLGNFCNTNGKSKLATFQLVIIYRKESILFATT